jgi:hypothetical protein
MNLELRIEQALAQTGGREMGACRWHPAGSRGGGFWACPCGWTSKVGRRGLGVAEEDAAVRHATRCDENWPARAQGGKKRHGGPLTISERFTVEAYQYDKWVNKGTYHYREDAVAAAREDWVRARVRDTAGAIVWPPVGGKRRKAIATKVGPRGGRTEIQSYLFPRALWTLEQVKRWAKKSTTVNYFGDVDVTDKYIRLRQADPKKFKRLRTKCLSRRKGKCIIKAVVGIR